MNELAYNELREVRAIINTWRMSMSASVRGYTQLHTDDLMYTLDLLYDKINKSIDLAELDNISEEDLL